MKLYEILLIQHTKRCADMDICCLPDILHILNCQCYLPFRQPPSNRYKPVPVRTTALILNRYIGQDLLTQYTFRRDLLLCSG